MDDDYPSQMVFANILYSREYDEVHAEMVALIRDSFSRVKSGLQSDSWIWIMEGDEKVAIDTFSSPKHQVKSYHPGPLVQRVIDALRGKYDVRTLDPPIEEWG